jgi:uncharacterized protein YjiS (DUF1127 family)
MEMHTSESLYAIHGIINQPRSGTRPRWIQSLLAMCSLTRRALQRELEIRRAVAELESLNDRLLNDIGISRHDIECVVRRRGSRVWRRPEDTPCLPRR